MMTVADIGRFKKLPWSYRAKPMSMLEKRIKKLESKITALAGQREAAYQEIADCADREWKARVEIKELRQAIRDADFLYYTRHGRFPE